MHTAPVLILGGQGYIGSGLATHLQASGFVVHSVDLTLRGDHGPAPNQRRAYQELTADELEAYDSIVLLAGHSSVMSCNREPAASHANNVGGFVDLVHKLRAQKLIYASSMSVYINTHGRLVTEDEGLPA